MTEPRHYACAVCRRVINRFRQPDGSITYNHSLEQLIAYDHDPVPRRADRIDGGVIAACDFCAAEDANCWIFTTSPIQMIATGTGPDLTTQYGTRWGCCPSCVHHASGRDLDQLHARAVAASGLPPGSHAAAAMRQMLATTLAALKPGREFLLDGSDGTPPDLAPRLLPKYRDRLTALLDDEDNILPGLHDPQTRAVLAAGLPVSRLYAIDELFTDMAVAAAHTLTGATLASVDATAPMGMLLFAHPVDSASTIAMSWTTDRATGTVHLATYRALGTRLSGTQLQHLREQAGWLVPTGRATISPGDPVSAGHPAAVLFTAWLLIAHRLTEDAPVPVDPAIRNTYRRARRPQPQVRIIQLRGCHRAEDSSSPEHHNPSTPTTRRLPDHRFWVPPYTRNQRHGPGNTLIKTVIIWPHLNGPKGRPVRASTAVRMLATPKPATPRTGSLQPSHLDGHRT